MRQSERKSLDKVAQDFVERLTGAAASGRPAATTAAGPSGTRRTPKFNGNAPHAARRVVRVEPRGSAARAWQSPSLSLALFFSVFHFFYFL